MPSHGDSRSAPRGVGGSGRGAARGGRGGATRVPHQGTLASHITTVGVKRPGYGTGGRVLPIHVNSFETSIPQGIIHHYDVISPSEKTLPARLNMDLIRELQEKVAPQLFTPRGVYDGRKNLFAARELPLDEHNTKDFNVSLGSGRSESGGKGPKVYKIRLTKVAEINPEVLRRFIAGEQSHDNTVLTAITALNVVIRMEPTMKYPFNVRSFFTDRETKDIGSGLQLWRGYFQSVRPASGRMLINVDISTGTMYKAGPLLGLCLEFLNKRDPNALAPSRGFPDRERLRLQRFISGIRILTKHAGSDGNPIPRVIKKLSSAGANALNFSMREGGSMSVADYFQRTQNRKLEFPDVICVEVSSGALIPLELCTVPPGQIMRKQVPPEKTRDVLDFATKRPRDRLSSIESGLAVLAYGQSEYVRQFGMRVESNGPLKVQARVLKPPVLRYGPGSKQPTVAPSNGAWNMVDKRFFRPATITGWCVIVYEQQRRFGEGAAQDMIAGLTASFQDVGIRLPPNYAPLVKWENGQGRIEDQLRAAGGEVNARHGAPPNLLVVVIPEGGNDIYTAVKHFGDITMGVATQCLKSSKCFRAKAQYYANVSLKINVKLGGINTVPEPSSVSVLTDPSNPTIVIGADVIHPAPGSDGRPSFTALVANVDSDTAKYIACCRVQTSRQEMIEDLEEMSNHVLTKYVGYRTAVEKKAGAAAAPKRIIFYRDGVSEGQFKQVLEQELPALKRACETQKINPKITIIVVGKRHHVRFFPQSERDGDRSGNCPAGTVVDRDVSHPTEFDFYLQSHGGLLGTSRPAHYSVLYDENNFSADSLQSLSFALCHVYARSTRSVSIPAPVYYADIVCSRAKNHYDPQGQLDFSDSTSLAQGSQVENSLEAFRRGFKPVHKKQDTLMYFS
ncbi:putative argonaute family protein [Lyophyllum shimeji]|uniref:Argonaute family protein n=1 Tax=Lyophyllum shimeji TaxID=47721 RepID=A0A9P3PDJ7_LYOSH|nr:putative argonaute family protein [Lyophyllum shimeji]